MRRITVQILCLMIALLLFTACSSVGNAVEPSDSYRSYSNKQSYAAERTDSPTEAADGKEIASSFEIGEKMIYTVSVSLETTSFDDSISVLSSVANEFDGYVEYSNVTGNSRYYSDGSTAVIQRTAQYRIAVPAEVLDLAVARIRSIGNVTSETSNADNVTSTYTDLSARLESLRVQEERILELMKSSDDIESLIVLEDKLADVTYQKESYQRRLENLDRQIAYSTITVRMDEVGGYTPTATVTRTFGERLGDAFRDGWSGFVSGMEDFLVWFAESLPGIILFAAFVLIMILLIRFLLRKFNTPRKQAEPENRTDSLPETSSESRKQQGDSTERE